ncbi:MAG TPA: winged helix-turn-helix transcriptional regulator [Candidatus Onthocola gallistercoris]|uniref:Winged helix-turn-helix transcriptional regulator n=1 Tax=Candidatus Onthocola gallistercoris TaxID=2840876 RepID=A0A9D1KYB5_9FIRM|nr:winged helix-turn-helix transcriptional regulator [Candidatus Onthocola gallistercoris]
MKLEWLGEYREFTEKLIKFGNAYAAMYKNENDYACEVKFSSTQLQVMEYILENEERHQNMAEMASRLAMSPSAFSKNVTKMVAKGMLEKYHTSRNKKDVIVQVTEFGRKAYREYVACVYEVSFKDMFKIMDNIPKEYIDMFCQVLDIAATRWGTGRHELPEEILIKIE